MRLTGSWRAVTLFALLAAPAGEAAEASRMRGPLRRHPENPRYFTDDGERAVYLTGSHTWSNLVDMGRSDPPPAFDFGAYLDWMERYHHNFMRLWTWELVTWNTVGNNPSHREEAQVLRVSPQPWARTGPGRALDGGPRYDLTRYDDEYFRRLRSRAEAAAERGIYVAVMCFEGWGLQRIPDAWKSHPMHPSNNVNSIDGDVNGDGKGLEVHTLARKKITEIQEAYVRRVVDTVNDLDNVLYEISNENHPASTEWQYHMIRTIQRYEAAEKPERHPVGMTFQFRGGSNRALFESPADWISPNHEGGYRDRPPPGDGRKVIITDTDHLWGIGGNREWVWKSFCRGLCPIFMDPYDGVVLGRRFDPRWEPVRVALGRTRRYAERMDLAGTRPLGKLASTGYCLARPGREYLVYRPGSVRGAIRLTIEAGSYEVEYLEPASGRVRRDGLVRLETGAGEPRRVVEKMFRPPFEGEAVLYLKRPRGER